MFDFYEILGNEVFDVLGVYALDRFYNDFKKIHNEAYPKDKTKQREFLFSDECVIEEIRHHCLGYWYTEDLIGLSETSYRLWIGVGGDEVELEKRCESIDIAEQDVYKIMQSKGFSYYFGIRPRYLYTLADPYWYGNFDRFSTPRPNWKTKKIPWDAKFLEWK